MATRPTEPTSLGVFFSYPADATGTVAPYWLASSPGSGHCVRLTGACKRAFLATIEAAIERAVAPANAGSYPAVNTNLVTAWLDQNDVATLVLLGAWAYAQNRAALGSKLVRGCPQEEWERLVRCVAALWHVSPFQTDAGTVYAWQTSMLDFETNGWVDGPINVYASCSDLSFSVADNAYMEGFPIALRLWGDFPGGTGGYPVVEWVSDALRDIGASVMDPSMTPGGYADGELNGTPAPLVRGHEGNWFGSTVGGMVGQDVSARRSSSAWAVMQSMLANMKFTHLNFIYAHQFSVLRTERRVERFVTMDEDTGDIYTVEVVNETVDAYTGSSSEILVTTGYNLVAGTATRYVKFYCAHVDEHNLAVFSRPADGWRRLGSGLVPYLVLGHVAYTGGARVELSIDETSGIASISAGGMRDNYPADAFAGYIRAYGPATFVDRQRYAEGGETVWTKYSVRPENGDRDLKVPVRNHAQWLLGQAPSIQFPNIGANPGTLVDATNRFWAGWEVFYPDQPNIQVDGQDAYFPTAFRNSAFVDSPAGYSIFKDSLGDWTSNVEEVVFGYGRMAFPDLASIENFGDRTWTITPAGSAMAGYEWAFKAMAT